MMSVVRDEVTEESADVGTKPLDTAVALQCATYHHTERQAALLNGAQGLRGGEAGAVELRGNIAAFGGGLQPHDANIVHVSDDRGDAASFAVWRLCLPGGGRQMVNQILIDAIVGVE